MLISLFFLYLSVHFFAFYGIKISGIKVPSLPKISRMALIFNHDYFGFRGEVTVYPIQNKTKQNTGKTWSSRRPSRLKIKTWRELVLWVWSLCADSLISFRCRDNMGELLFTKSGYNIESNSHSSSQTINNYWTRVSKISWFVSGEQINYLPKPKAEANNWSARHWQITIFCDNRVQ